MYSVPSERRKRSISYGLPHGSSRAASPSRRNDGPPNGGFTRSFNVVGNSWLLFASLSTYFSIATATAMHPSSALVCFASLPGGVVRTVQTTQPSSSASPEQLTQSRSRRTLL